MLIVSTKSVEFEHCIGVPRLAAKGKLEKGPNRAKSRSLLRVGCIIRLKRPLDVA
jgi:hypothetical protein